MWNNENYKYHSSSLFIMGDVEKLEGQVCPVCLEKKLVLTEEQTEVPYFGLVYLFSMVCSGCNYKKADIEVAKEQEPSKFSIEIDSEEDMKIRIIKSSEATVRIPHVTTITSGPSSEGYISNIEGLLMRVKAVIESTKDDEDEEVRKKAKNLLKKLQRVMWGQEKLKITIEDPTGNSAIISEKAIKSKL